MPLSAMYLFAFTLGFQLLAASWIARFARHASAHHGSASSIAHHAGALLADFAALLVYVATCGGFLVTLGAVGIIGSQLGAAALPTAVVAVVAGFATAALIVALPRSIAGRRTSTRGALTGFRP